MKVGIGIKKDDWERRLSENRKICLGLEKQRLTDKFRKYVNAINLKFWKISEYIFCKRTDETPMELY